MQDALTEKDGVLKKTNILILVFASRSFLMKKYNRKKKDKKVRSRKHSNKFRARDLRMKKENIAW